MRSSINRISFKLLLLVLLMLLLLGSATALIVAHSFGETQREVTRRSAEGLQAQGAVALRTLTQREAELSTATLQQGVATSEKGAQYLVQMARLGGSVPYDPQQLVREPSGQWHDPNPARHSEVVLPNTVQRIDAVLERDLQQSAVLDALFPSLMTQYHDAVAVYYMSPTQLTRYYPLTELHTILSPEYQLTQDPSYTIAAPPRNPQRKTVWRAPYVDMGGQGLIVTASTPVYQDDQFRGVFAVDVSLTRLVDHLNTLKPTPGDFAFLIDGDGLLIAAPPTFLPQLLADDQTQTTASLSDTLNLNLAAHADPALQGVIGAMRLGKSGIQQVDFSGRPTFVSYAPLTNTRWSLGAVAPIDELTAQSQNVAKAIERDAAFTMQQTLAAMSVIFVLALLGTLVMSHRMLTRPIAALARGTKAITSGNLALTIPVTSRDEMGRLAVSFNHMTGEIRQSRQLLEQQQAELSATNARLREREAQYRSIFEATSDGLVINAVDGTIVEANPAACRMHGYTYPELIGQQPTLIVHPAYHGMLHEFLRGVTEDGTYQTQAIDVRKDGTQFHVEASGARFTYNGQPAILGVIRDVTERVEAYQLLEQRVGERTHELHTLFDISRTVASTLELDKLLSVILQQAKTLIAYDAAAVSLLDSQHTLNFIAYEGPIPQAALPRRWSMAPFRDERTTLATLIAESEHDESAFGREVVYSGEPVIIPDIGADTSLARTYRRRVEHLLGSVPDYIGTWMGVPLVARDRVIGMISFDHGKPHHYTPYHAELALALASQAAVAIENATLLADAQDKAALEERQKLARELHDSVSQALYGIALGARTARTLLDHDPQRVAEPLEYVLQLADAGMAEMRALIFELRPESLATEGIVAALRKQAASLKARHHIAVTTTFDAEPDVPLSTKEALYRIAQEALHNTVKHARATAVELCLERNAERLTLLVRDNGIGFDATQEFPGHLGLVSIRERVERVGGTLRIRSRPGDGTEIYVDVPVREQDVRSRIC